MANETNLTNNMPIEGDYVTVMNAVQQIILPVICTCGIIGLVLTIVVLSRKNMCTSTNCHLMALAIADFVFLLLSASCLLRNHIKDESSSNLFEIYEVYANIFMHTFLMASIWCTVMLAVERYIAICQPFIATKVCTVTKARIMIIVIFFTAFCLRLPNFWEYTVTSHVDQTTNLTWTFKQSTEFAYDHHYVTIYPWIVDGVMASMLPFLLLLFLNTRLIWEVRKSTQYLQRNVMVGCPGTNSVVQREELQITIMLISVIIVYFICQVPYVIYTAIVSINRNNIPASPGLLVFHSITMLLLTLKSAINFILYCWFSEKFWLTLRRIFCQECCIPRDKAYATQNGNYYHLRRLSSCATRETTFWMLDARNTRWQNRRVDINYTSIWHVWVRLNWYQ